MDLIRASLGNPYAVTVMSLTIIVLGTLSLHLDSDRYSSRLQKPRGPDAHLLQRHVGHRASRTTSPTGWSAWTGQANGMARQESRSILGASIVRNYFQGDVDPNGALDSGELASPGGHSQSSARNPSPGGLAVRPDLDHARVRGGR